MLMFMELADCAAVLLAFAILRVYLRRRTNPSGLPTPPGPKPLPIIGNILDIPTRSSWVTYARWAQQYGDIISLKVLGQTIVILNTPQIARDLFERRSSIYSDRPAFPAFEMMNLNFNLSVKRYGDSWKIGRNMIDHSFRQSTSMTYRPMQMREVHRFLRKIVHRPDDVIDYCRQLTAAIIMSVTYGYKTTEPRDHFVELAEDAVERAIAAMLPGATIINTFPTLRHLPAWLPGLGLKREAIRKWQQVQETIDAPFEFAKGEIIKGSAEPSMVDECFASFSDTGLTETEEHILKEVAATTYLAGTDTMTSAISCLFKALALHPDVQRRAQEELDTVIGRERLPTFDDRPQLPYVEAVCQELRRWRPVAPMALPHTTTEDDVYEGYFIPKGSQVLANVWAMFQNPAVYLNPDTFCPERFLSPDGTLVDDPALKAAFGFGRRVCPGRFLADATIWAAVASVLSVFTICKAKDVEGRDIPVDDALTDHGLICHPTPFQFSIIPRDAQSKQLIAETNV